MTEEQYTELQAKTLAQLKTGQPLLGKNGALAPLLKQFIETALEAEMETHLGEEERLKGNKRNGRGTKTVKTAAGEVTINPPLDRHASYDPQLVRKRETILADSLTSKIIALYGKGMSLRDISQYIEEMYDTSISATTLSQITDKIILCQQFQISYKKLSLSQITDKIIPEIKQWQNRPLESVYTVVFLDAMHYKVRE